MKTKVYVVLTLTFLATLVAPLPTLHAQGSAFTYQGVFTQNGAPFSGTVEMQFTLWDAASSGTQIAATAPTSLLVVASNGLFNASVDFGATPFSGADRWVQVEARTTLAPFTTLSPRQKVTATPYALRAANFTGTLGSNQIAGLYVNAVILSNAANVFTGTFTGNGGGLTNLNVTSLGGLSVSNFWRTDGNAGTTAGANFLGTTDNQALELKVGGQRALRLESATTVTNFIPGASIIWSNAPNVIAGSSYNIVDSEAVGASVAGGAGGYYVNPGTGYVFVSALINQVSAALGTIGGGGQNTIQYGAYNATISGGQNNTIQTNAYAATIGGGSYNTIQTDSLYATISGGNGNTIETNGYAATVGGGSGNKIMRDSEYATIGGGLANLIRTNADYGTIAGGSDNRIYDGATYASIGGGNVNLVLENAVYAAVGGGRFNQITTQYGTIGGGDGGSVTGYGGTVAGGMRNRTDSFGGTVGGGTNNFILGAASYATIPGGANNRVSGSYGFAAGRRALANNTGAFVWADSTDADFASAANNQFLIRAAGGVGIGTTQPPAGGLRVHSGGLAVSGFSSPNYGTAAGVFIESGGASGLVFAYNYGTATTLPLLLNSPGGNVGIGTTSPLYTLHVNGSVAGVGAYNNLSDARYKKDIRPLQHAMETVQQLRGVRYDWRREEYPGLKFDQGEQVGFVAQEVKEVLPEAVNQDAEGVYSIAYTKVIPVLVEAIKEQQQKTERALQAKDAEIKALNQRLETLERSLQHHNRK